MYDHETGTSFEMSPSPTSMEEHIPPPPLAPALLSLETLSLESNSGPVLPAPRPVRPAVGRAKTLRASHEASDVVSNGTGKNLTPKRARAPSGDAILSPGSGGEVSVDVCLVFAVYWRGFGDLHVFLALLHIFTRLQLELCVMYPYQPKLVTNTTPLRRRITCLTARALLSSILRGLEPSHPQVPHHQVNRLVPEDSS